MTTTDRNEGIVEAMRTPGVDFKPGEAADIIEQQAQRITDLEGEIYRLRGALAEDMARITNLQGENKRLRALLVAERARANRNVRSKVITGDGSGVALPPFADVEREGQALNPTGTEPE